MRSNIMTKMGAVIGALMAVAAGCADSGLDNQEAMGTARVQVIVPQASAGEIDRVTVQANGGAENDLTPDGTGSFAGTLLLPAGPSELVGRAYAAGTQVGQSNPVAVDIQAGLVTSATIQILDTTGGVPLDHGPIVLSLTHPMSAVANQPVSLSIEVIDPDGDALGITWSDDCADSTFTDSLAATTEWVKTAEGSCTVSVEVSAGGLSVVRDFRITVFAEGTASGAVDVDGRFIPAPTIHLGLDYGGTFCGISGFEGANASCPEPITTLHSARVQILAEWNSAQPGTVEVFDDCGGSFQPLFSDPMFMEGNWTAPSTAGVCFVTVRATSIEGVRSDLVAAVAVQAGDPPPPPPPPPPADIQITADFFGAACFLPPDLDSTTCPNPVAPGQPVDFTVRVEWGSFPPGSIALSDSCGGAFDLMSDGISAGGVWFPELNPDGTGTCTVFVDAISADGQGTQSTLSFSVF